jgi:NAD(P)-dependent dehydrogenase (short-subunit alcohol dehydrogenase family)
MVEEAIKHFGKIDILINNAGIRHIKKLLDHTKKDWDEMIAVNLTGPYLSCKAVIPHMIKQGKGKIVNFGSIASFMGRPDRVGYVAAKSGVLGLTRALAVDLTRKNINVNTICPGLISTPFNKKFAEDPTHGEAWGKETIVGRWGLPTDIVGAAVFLSSDESDFINGTEIKIDGGWLAAKTRKGEINNE